MTPLDPMALWQRTLAPQGGPLDARREVLRQAFLGFRERVAVLVQTVGAELSNLTVHDITHLDALWRVADQIAGPDYPINPAEAFVLGGAFLLHDAAHVMAAYPGGISSIKQTVQWQDLIAQRYDGRDPEGHSDEERSALFQVLRYLHAEQAHTLARLEWTVPNAGPKLHLLEHLELREYYADLKKSPRAIIGPRIAWPRCSPIEGYRHPGSCSLPIGRSMRSSSRFSCARRMRRISMTDARPGSCSRCADPKVSPKITGDSRRSSANRRGTQRVSCESRRAASSRTPSAKRGGWRTTPPA